MDESHDRALLLALALLQRLARVRGCFVSRCEGAGRTARRIGRRAAGQKEASPRKLGQPRQEGVGARPLSSGLVNILKHGPARWLRQGSEKPSPHRDAARKTKPAETLPGLALWELGVSLAARAARSAKRNSTYRESDFLLWPLSSRRRF